MEATLPLPKEEVVRTMEGQGKIVESDEERRSREIMEGAVDKRPGYVEVHVAATAEGEMTEEVSLPKWDEESVRGAEAVLRDRVRTEMKEQITKDSRRNMRHRRSMRQTSCSACPWGTRKY